MPLFILLFMQSLFAVVLRERPWAIIGVCAGPAILTQIHLTTAALVAVAILGLVMWRPRLRAVHLLAGLGAGVVLYAPYIGYGLAHRFENTRAILHGLDRPAGNW